MYSFVSQIKTCPLCPFENLSTADMLPLNDCIGFCVILGQERNNIGLSEGS